MTTDNTLSGEPPKIPPMGGTHIAVLRRHLCIYHNADEGTDFPVCERAIQEGSKCGVFREILTLVRSISDGSVRLVKREELVLFERSLLEAIGEEPRPTPADAEVWLQRVRRWISSGTQG